MDEADLRILVGELERYLEAGALADALLRGEMRRFLRGVDQGGPAARPELAAAIAAHPRRRELYQLLGWTDPKGSDAVAADLDRAGLTLDRIERLIEAGAWMKPEPRERLRRLLAGLGGGDPLNSPVMLRALEKRRRRVELMRILEWRNSGEPPLRAEAMDRDRRSCPYCGRVYGGGPGVAQCPQCGRVSEVVREE